MLITGIKGLTVTVTLAMTLSPTTLEATRVYVVVLVGERVTAPWSGVSEVGEAEEVEGILKARYSSKKISPKLKDLRRFIRLVEKDPGKARMFSTYLIFKRVDDKWGNPPAVFLDSPWVETGLSAYYDALADNSAPKALSDAYRRCGVAVARILKFAKAVGVTDTLPVSITRCQENPQWDYLRRVPGERYTSPINRDYEVKDLDRLLKSPSLELSRLVWRTMCDLDREHLQATYQKNDSNGSRSTHSQLVHQLKNVPWVPQKDGSFVQPCDASRGQLPKGFPFDEGQEWLAKVGFGENVRKSRESDEERDKHCKALGIRDPKTIEIAKELEHDDDLRSDVIALIEERKNKPDFPTGTSPNPERRQERLSKELEDTPDKEWEGRKRSVRKTRGSIDPRPWLRNKYTNEKEQMFCQICKKEMPFKKRNGEYYFEAIEALTGDHFTKEHEAQFLALCPLCAAMYKELVKKDESAVESLKNALMNSDKPEIPLHLGELATSVLFVDSHYRDIGTILGADE